MCKTLSLEFAGDNILVNNVCPGSHPTDRLRELAEVRASKAGTTAVVLLGRRGDPNELASTFVFLCTQPASYITGQSIVVEGGAYRGVF